MQDMESMAISYFRELSPAKKRSVLKKVVKALSDDEKVELAKMILKK